ncbi:MAG: helix-turn-helix transcriptional regulator [Clostridia bacterium]|nr:helix-turn-helix transcriptional regulator [Clostridia bacterium]
MISSDTTCNVIYDFDVVGPDTKKRGIHSHSYNELYFLENSELTYFVGNQIIPVSAGEFIFVPRETVHYTNYESSESVRRHVIFFSDSFVREELLPHLEELKTNNHIVISPERIHHILNILKKIQTEQKHTYADTQLMLNILVEELIITIIRYKKKEQKASMTPLQQSIQDIALYISNNITADLSLSALSKLFNISPSHLSKQFKINTGVGLNEYINIARVSVGETYLLNTNLSITEIAFKCGFNDSNYFTRVFKKVKGITPKAFSMQK